MINRRQFLALGLGVSTAAVVGERVARGQPGKPWDANAFAPIGQARVSVVRASSYDTELSVVVEDALRSIGASFAGASVLLKPNLVEYDPGSAINTDPRLVAATVIAVRRLGAASVIVGEGPGHRRDTDYVAGESGLLAALREVGAGFVDLNTAPAQQRSLHTRYSRLGELWLPRPVLDADVVVSMPKLKTHHWAGATLSMKNLFGCVPGRLYGWPKNVLHWAGLEGSIIDVAAAIRPAYAIVDGIVGMEGDGPIRGAAKAAGVLVVGDDLVATDAVAARVMGFDPERLGYLAEAGRFLGEVHLEEIAHRGEDPERVASSFATLERFAGLKLR